MKNLLLVFGVLLTVAAVTGCSNTFDGVGKDLNNTGDWFEETF
jgi:predicted small secreted protein